MAYEIISQNNTTTTLSDGVNVIRVPARVVLATSTTYTVTKVNNNIATLEDGNGKVYKDIPCVAVLYGGSGGGGSSLPDQTGHSGEFLTTDGTDASWEAISQLPDQTGYSGRVLGTDGFVAGWVEPEIVQRDVMPQADSSNVNKIYEFVGTTDANYTNGYFYKNVQTSSYDSTVTFQPATLSSSTIACSGSDFAAFVSEWGTGDITTITNGTLTYDQSGGLLVFVGKDAEDTTVCTFQMYTEDYQDAGFTITGTLQDGDVFAFTTTITESFSYAWTRVDVQPTPSELPNQSGNSGKFLTTDGTNPSWATVGGLPDQTGQSGKFLTTDGTDASWATINALQNTATGTNALTILGTATNQLQALNVGVNSFAYKGAASVGYSAEAGGDYSACIGHQSHAAADYSIAVGYNAHASYPNGDGAIAIGKSSHTGMHYAIAIGANTNAGGKRSIAIGSAASGAASATAHGAIQLGGGTNSDAGTFSVGLYDGSNSYNYKLLASDGTIPADRLTHAINKYSTMPTAASTNEGWIVQYTGATDSTYTHGYIYECVSDGQTPATYSWTAVSVQAGGGGSSYTAGTGIDITSGVISVAAPTLQNTATGTSSITIGGTPQALGYRVNIGVASDGACAVGYQASGVCSFGYRATASLSNAAAFGSDANASGAYATAIGCDSQATGNTSIALGRNAKATAQCAYMIGPWTNSTANTLKVGFSSASYELLSSDGTIPAARHASLPAADGTYVLKLVIASGVPTLSWVAE